MGVIHELRADYRYLRTDHPRFSWLFSLLDILFTLFKLALVAGLLFAGWYLMNRASVQSPVVNTETASSVISTAGSAGDATDNVDEVNTAPIFKAPELTSERIALLRQIERQSAANKDIQVFAATSAALVGQVKISDNIVVTEKAGQGIPTTLSAATSEDVAESAAIVFADEPKSSTTVLVASLETPNSLPILLPEPKIAEAVEQEDDAAVIAVSTVPNEVTNESTSDTSGAISDQQWVLNQPSRNFTLQIALTANQPFLISFAGKLPNEFFRAIYPERRTSSGNIEYSLSMGSFVNQANAESALAALPEIHKRYGAHLRRFEEIHGRLAAFSVNISQ